MSNSALNSALSALFAHANAVSNRAGNVANAQTGGYKAIEARLSSFVSQGAAGGVLATPALSAAVQGAILQTPSATSIAVAGSGWLPVRADTSAGSELLYTRRGDFAPDGEGYLRNGAGQVLQAQSVSAAGPLVPVRIDRASVPAQPTTTASYAANLPANAPPGTVFNGGSITVVDAQGTARSFDIVWYNRTTAGGTLPGVPAGATTGTAAIPASAAGTVPQWRAVLTARTGSANGPESLAMDFSFGTTANVDAGLPVAVAVQSTNPATLSAASSAGRVTIGYGAPTATPVPLQQVAVEFGAPSSTAATPSQLGAPGGLTSFGGTAISISRASADGATAGTFIGAGIDAAGQVYATYSNGRIVPQYRLALADFPNPGGLVAAGGEAFRAGPEAGAPALSASGQRAFAANAGEASNVDIGDELVRTMVAQRAYTASARLVAASDAMLKELVRLRQR